MSMPIIIYLSIFPYYQASIKFLSYDTCWTFDPEFELIISNINQVIQSKADESVIALENRLILEIWTIFLRMLDLNIAAIHLLRKKWRLIVRKREDSNPFCQRFIRKLRVMLFYFFHLAIDPMNASHLNVSILSFCLSIFLFFQMNLNSSFPIFFVTFLVILFPLPIMLASFSALLSFSSFIQLLFRPYSSIFGSTTSNGNWPSKCSEGPSRFPTNDDQLKLNNQWAFWHSSDSKYAKFSIMLPSYSTWKWEYFSTRLISAEFAIVYLLRQGHQLQRL